MPVSAMLVIRRCVTEFEAVGSDRVTSAPDRSRRLGSRVHSSRGLRLGSDLRDFHGHREGPEVLVPLRDVEQAELDSGRAGAYARKRSTE